MARSHDGDSDSSHDDLSVYATEDIISSTRPGGTAHATNGRRHDRSDSIHSTKSARSVKTQHRRTSSTGITPTGNRSRARAFSFLRDRNSTIPLQSLSSDGHSFSASRSPSISFGRSRAGSMSYPPQSHFGQSQTQFSENPFETDDYENALASPHADHSPLDSSASEEDDDDDNEDAAARRAERTVERERRRASKIERRGYRESFQPLLPSELSWMGVSAAAVLALTVLAVVISFGGKAVVIGASQNGTSIVVEEMQSGLM